MKQFILHSLTLLLFTSSIYSQNNTIDAVDDYFEQMGSADAVFYPLQNDVYSAPDSLMTFTILGAVDCADVLWDEVNNELLVTFTDLAFCPFNYSLCDNLGNCDIAQVLLQYQCYPWDNPLEMIELDIVAEQDYSFDLMNPCSSSAQIFLDFLPDSIDYVYEDGAISFSGDYIGEEFFSYFINEMDVFGCIICGGYYEYTLNFDMQNSIESTEQDIISIYPNPATETIRIKSSSPVFNVNLFNALGQDILLTPLSNIQYTLPDVAAGVYFIIVESENSVSSRKVIIE